MESFFNRDAIGILTNEGYNVLQVFPNNFDDVQLFFIINEFTPAFKSSVEEIRYNSLKGIDITDFMRVNASNPNIDQFKARLNEVIASGKVVRMQFNEHMRWIKWSIVTN